MHINAKLQKVMREVVNIKTYSTHKEVTDSRMIQHQQDVHTFKEKCRGY